MFDKGSVDHFCTNDKADWLKLWCAYVAPRHPERAQLAICDAIWSAVVSQDGRLHARALRNNDRRVCGFVHYVRYFSTHAGVEETYLMDLYVDPSFRQMRGGAALIEHALADCRTQQSSRMTWLTVPGVERNEKFYSQYAQRKSWDRYVVTMHNLCEDNAL